MIYLSRAGLSRLSWKRTLNGCGVVVVYLINQLTVDLTVADWLLIIQVRKKVEQMTKVCTDQ